MIINAGISFLLSLFAYFFRLVILLQFWREGKASRGSKPPGSFGLMPKNRKYIYLHLYIGGVFTAVFKGKGNFHVDVRNRYK